MRLIGATSAVLSLLACGKPIAVQPAYTTATDIWEDQVIDNDARKAANAKMKAGEEDAWVYTNKQVGDAKETASDQDGFFREKMTDVIVRPMKHGDSKTREDLEAKINANNQADLEQAELEAQKAKDQAAKEASRAADAESRLAAIELVNLLQDEELKLLRTLIDGLQADFDEALVMLVASDESLADDLAELAQASESGDDALMEEIESNSRLDDRRYYRLARKIGQTKRQLRSVRRSLSLLERKVDLRTRQGIAVAAYLYGLIQDNEESIEGLESRLEVLEFLEKTSNAEYTIVGTVTSGFNLTCMIGQSISAGKPVLRIRTGHAGYYKVQKYGSFTEYVWMPADTEVFMYSDRGPGTYKVSKLGLGSKTKACSPPITVN